MTTFGKPIDMVDVAWTREPIRVARCKVLHAPMDQPDIDGGGGVEVVRSDNPRLAFAQHFARAGYPIIPRVIVDRTSYAHSTAVLGGEGFGHEWDGRRWVPFPHVGGVVIEDDVTVGAHTCIDRGALGNTIIRRGARIDNLVHIAHNVMVGEYAVIVAHALICGSAVIGPRAWIGGGAIIKEGVTVGAGAVVGLGAVVTKDVPPGETWAGVPARAR